MRLRLERTPLGILALAAAGGLFFVLPLLGLLVRAPWPAAVSELTAPANLVSLQLSLLTSLSATALALVFGVPLAWVNARLDFPGRNLLRALVTLPMVLPPVVGGAALLFAFGRGGFGGSALAAVGVHLPFHTPGVIAAETFVAMPFLVVATEAGFRSMDQRYEDAARTLGAGRLTVFGRVTIPLVAPSLAAGAALCWARALGEFGATITFAGNLPGRTQTLPLAVYLELQTRPEVAVLLSLVLLTVSVVVLVALRGRWVGLGRP